MPDKPKTGRGWRRRGQLTFRDLASLIKPEDGRLTTPCWVVQGRARVDGYVKLSSDGKVALAHRIMYQLLFGPISDGLVVRHHCDRRDCINPCHLDVGTVAHNNADTMARGRNRNLRGNENGRSRLTEQQIPQIRLLLKECKLSQRQVAEQFEVSEPLIGRISRGEIWKHVIARGAARDSWV